MRLHGLAEALAGGNRRFVEMLAAEFGAGFAVENLASGQQEIAEHADGINIAPGIALIRIADGLGRDEVGRARGASLAETLAKEEARPSCCELSAVLALPYAASGRLSGRSTIIGALPDSLSVFRITNTFSAILTPGCVSPNVVTNSRSSFGPCVPSTTASFSS